MLKPTAFAACPACARALPAMSLKESNDPPATWRVSHGCCWARLKRLDWGRMLFADDPAPSALLLIFALVLTPLFEGLWLPLALLLVSAFLLRAWLWCRGGDAEAPAENRASASAAVPEQHAGDCP